MDASINRVTGWSWPEWLHFWGLSKIARGKLLLAYGLVVLILVVMVNSEVVRSGALDPSDRYREARNLARIVDGVLRHEALQAQNGDDEAIVKGMALNLLRSIEIDQGHLWIADLSDKTFLYHPLRKDVEGQSLSTLRDINGKPVYQDLLASDTPGSSFTKIHMPDADDPNGASGDHYVETIAFAPFHWVVGINLRAVDGVYSPADFLIKYVLLFVLFAALVLLPFALYRARVRRVAAGVIEAFRCLTYARPLPRLYLPETKDEMGEIVEAYNLLLESDALVENNFNRIQSARQNPVVRKIINMTHEVDIMSSKLLDIGNYFSKLDFSGFQSTIAQVTSQVEQLDRCTSEFGEIISRLSFHNKKEFMRISNANQNERGDHEALATVRTHLHALHKLVHVARSFGVRVELDSVAVNLEMSGKNQRRAREALKTMSEGMRQIGADTSRELEASLPAMDKINDSIKRYRELEERSEAVLHARLQGMHRARTKVNEISAIVAELERSLQQLQHHASEIALNPFRASVAAFTRDALALGQRSERARNDIKRTLLFGKR